MLRNRAPTHHRLVIQAFQSNFVDCRAFELQPLVCPVLNADFDRDLTAVRIPLSIEAQGEAGLLILAPQGFQSHAIGLPSIMPKHGMVSGSYFLTTSNLSAFHGQLHFFWLSTRFKVL